MGAKRNPLKMVSGWLSDKMQPKAPALAVIAVYIAAILDKSLQGRSFLLGQDYSLVDTHVNSIVDWLRHMKVDLAPHKNLTAWSARCCDRPAYKKAMAGAF